MASRQASIQRATKETEIELALTIDGTGVHDIQSPLPFLNHMLESFSRHGFFDLDLKAKGDIEVDAHHTVEDVGLCLGDAFAQALDDYAGIIRYGAATLPMDDTLVTCALDFCRRPALEWRADILQGKWVGSFDCELAREFFGAFSARAQCNVHVLVHYGTNAHHIIESVFKAFARAADVAATVEPRLAGRVASTKGTLNA